MALLHVDFFSDVLGMCTSADVILPQQTSGQIGMEGKGAEGKLKTTSIRTPCMTAPCGWHGTTIPRQAIQNQERHIRTWHTIMNSGSIHLLQK